MAGLGIHFHQPSNAIDEWELWEYARWREQLLKYQKMIERGSR